MRLFLTRIFCLPILICPLVVFPYSLSEGAEKCEEWVGKVASVQGDVQAKAQGETQWNSVQLNDIFCPGDMIRTLGLSRAAIVLSNETIIRLDQDTTITFTGIEKKETSLLDIFQGVVHFISRVPRSLKIITPFVNASIEGTEFVITVRERKTSLTVFEGKVAATNQAGTLTLTSGQSAVAEAGQAPSLRVVVRPRDAVQWALYYPPLLDFRPDDFPGVTETDWQAMVRRSIRFYWQGNLTEAFQSIENVPQNLRDPHFFTYRASLLLTVGRAADAQRDIDRALDISPDNSQAIALESILAVAQNDKEKALSRAQKAVEADQNSATAHIALSYARKAHFDLKGALASIQKAVQLNPDNSLAWARLAELRLSVGNLDGALQAAKKAVELNPHLARTQTVLGYAYLSQIKVQESKMAFEKAIELDQAAPLPRMGLGLARIREGNLEEGRREIEIAASLDPNTSLIRSYLGKSYYEEKRNKLAREQYALAKELDPKDPTPFFYDAIRKQTVNRPVEALRDLQKSIQLNDNRAIYRSKLQLDDDLAARSAALGRIYKNLGFEQIALVEGWNSVNIDASNYSAHRFLADTYSSLPRHEIARVSELLQSQLLQPLNITPVQPQLAESNLFIFDRAGPGDLSFNEFNPLFNRNRLALQLNGIVGGNDTYGDEVVFSGVHDKVSFSVGQYHYQTHGFRDNNDQDHDIFNVFVQAMLSHKTSIQAEYRHKESDNGDLDLNFNLDNFIDDFHHDEQSSSIRLGAHHRFSQSSDLIASFIYKDFDEKFDFSGVSDSGPPFFLLFDFRIKNKEETDGFLGEIQHLFRSDLLQIISGAGHFNSDVERQTTTITTGITIPSPPDTQIDIKERDVLHTNLYLYSLVHYPKTVTLSLGVSADFFDGLQTDENQVNTKFGITWTPLSSTTLRAAVFRTLKRQLISSQTIEPTQIAGFNQFFDDIPGTDSWRYGAAIDQTITDGLFGGVEVSRRELDVPFEKITIVPPSSIIRHMQHDDWEERILRAYLYWTPAPWLAASGEYLYERFERDESFFDEFEKVRTHRFPFRVSLFHPSGLSAHLKTTYVDQEGDFYDQLSGTIFEGGDHFWLVDAAIGYRLPKRLGLITLEARNLVDEEFNFQDTDPANPNIYPERLILGRFTLSF